jgi:N6-L-threonylcarbamoyladenine synthase
VLQEISHALGLIMGEDLILGIESSCDDTAVALVTRDGEVVSALTQSQVRIHAEWGGVFPELASRAHAAEIIPTIKAVMAEADIGPERVKAIAVTRGPGLIGPLMVGVNSATGLGMAWQKPVIGVNHLRGHLRSAALEGGKVKYPALVLLVSGGHTLLALMENADSVRILGASRDDSVGEAYDKTARLLGLGFPGGPEIDKLAKLGEPSIEFPRPMLREGLEFSFSGLKAAVARCVERAPNVDPANVAASFVAAVLDVLSSKCASALSETNARSLVVVGGVAASAQVRQRMSEVAASSGAELALPPLKWSTDNGAMIALAGWDYFVAGRNPALRPVARLSIQEF